MSPFLLVALLVGPAGADTALAIRTQSALDRVRHLGHPEYRARERAARELVQLGEAALGPLRVGERDPDPERSTRCRAVRAQIEEALLAGKLAHLLAKPAAPPAPGLPGLDRFLAIAGDSPGVRTLYADVFTGCRPCLDSLAKRSDTLGDVFRVYCTRIDIRLRRPRPTAVEEQELRLRPADLAALSFFVGQMPAEHMSDDIYGAVNRVCYSKDAIDLLSVGGPDAPQRRLLVAALRRHGNGGLRAAMLWLAGRCKMKEAAPVLIEMLGDPRLNDFARGEVLVYLGALGTRETAADVRRMKSLFQSTTEVTSVQFPRDMGLPVMTTQLRDVAVGVCAEMEGRDLGQLGFRPEPRKYFSDDPSTARYALIDDTSRADVHRRWHELVDKSGK